MSRLSVFALSLLAACGPVEQPEGNHTVAAYEVPLPTAADKTKFLALLTDVAEADGYHVDAATQSELEAMSEVSPITFNASVWRGNDEESMASAMDFQDRIGRVWLSFPKGQDPRPSDKFRAALISKIKAGWPDTAWLPIMPSGAIPLTQDLIRTSSGYEVRAAAADKYKRTNP